MELSGLAVDALEVQLLHPDARPPRPSRSGDAGYDLYCLADLELPGRERLVVATGVAIALPEGVCGLVVPRSGLAANHGVTPFLGLIDPNFRGELRVTLLNTSRKPFRARAGDRIAQLLLLPFWAPAVRLVDALPEAPDDRGANGWGSSGP